MSADQAQLGWVLHRRPWRESSLLIEFFGREQGRTGLVARAARSARSPWRGLAEPFALLSARWTRRGEMGTLTGLEPAGHRVMLSGRALWCGLYANELIMKLLARDDPSPEIFEAYALLIEQLGNDQPLASAVRTFELALLGALGVAPDFTHDANDGSPIDPSARYHLDPEAGFLPVQRDGQAVYAGQTILALAGQVEESAAGALDSRRLMRQLIDHQLAGRPLESRRLFEKPSSPKRS
ncbi:DNA repair protein RecO [Wenzhouxiangella sp. AB-CW3]|uniref:DNA repair protein RecO n=1 Tax=Wenzhouxiangella sp. AB-CW3 TaxID=2771012 RepID=UPI00168AEF0C|nr:DNA repair protein RecO [Wenzhouxiangella sp. AB-CW3]QOC23479.1 DNA repair protein RecO [Wenzhouxiangella sp. AB-CW3]